MRAAKDAEVMVADLEGAILQLRAAKILMEAAHETIGPLAAAVPKKIKGREHPIHIVAERIDGWSPVGIITVIERARDLLIEQAVGPGDGR